MGLCEKKAADDPVALCGRVVVIALYEIVIEGMGSDVRMGCEQFSAFAATMQPFMLFQTLDQLLQFFIMLFQQVQPLAQFTDGGILRIDAVDDVVHHLSAAVFEAFTVTAHDPARNADDGAVGRNILIDDGVRADLSMLADGDGTQYLCSHSHQNAVTQRRVSFYLVQAGAAQGDLMVQQHIVAYDRGFADDHSVAMIDKEAAADGRSGMDLDAGKKTAELRDQPGQQ